MSGPASGSGISAAQPAAGRGSGQRFQQPHPGRQPAAGFLVPGEPVGHLTGQHHIVELATPQARPFRAAIQPQHRQIAVQQAVAAHP